MENNLPFKNIIESEEELESIAGSPGEAVMKKAVHHLDHHCQDFIAKSPFLTISTSDQSGRCDVSPRGDYPGFVHILNENQLIIPERPGNRRMDTLRNILSNQKIGILFFIPGLGETLRVNGTASLVKDEQLLKIMAFKEKQPLLGVGVDVEECFIHCAKAFKRSGLWETDTWTAKDNLPKASRILFDHINMPDVDEKAIAKDLQLSYKHGLY